MPHQAEKFGEHHIGGGFVEIAGRLVGQHQRRAIGEAAGDRDVLLHGSAAARACLRTGMLDEMALQIVPVLLGQGRRLFDDMTGDHVELELLRALDGPRTLHVRYRVLPGDGR